MPPIFEISRLAFRDLKKFFFLEILNENGSENFFFFPFYKKVKFGLSKIADKLKQI